MLTASYFDGKSSRRHLVRLDIRDGQLEVIGDGITLRLDPRRLEISEPLGDAPRTLRLADGQFIEVAAGGELDTLLAGLAYRPSLGAQLHAHWSLALFALFGVACLFAAAYQWGLPWTAKATAPMVPQAVVERISQQALDEFDKRWLKPSKLSPERQAALRQAFDRLSALQPETQQAKLHFRSAKEDGANAFALPDGQVVLLDGLVALSDDDQLIAGVLAHELGHVYHLHGVRQMIQSSVIAAAAAVWLGDVSSLASVLGTLVLTSGYSRAMEEEADDYALASFRQLKQPLDALPAMLEKLEAADRKPNDKPAAEGAASGTEIFSSHPATAERIRRLREQMR